jgi:hypothetical protein
MLKWAVVPPLMLRFPYVPGLSEAGLLPVPELDVQPLNEQEPAETLWLVVGGIGLGARGAG